jgi:hypothetical protein
MTPERRRKPGRGGAAAWLACASLLVACSHVYRAPAEGLLQGPAAERIPLTVGLRLSDALLTAQESGHSLGQRWRFELGGCLTRNAKAVTEDVFQKVVLVSPGDAAPAAGVDAWLTPALLSVDRTVGTMPWNDVSVRVAMEWAVEDAQGRLVWVETLRGSASGKAGWFFTRRERERELRAALEQAFGAAQEQLSSAPEIRRLAARP